MKDLSLQAAVPGRVRLLCDLDRLVANYRYLAAPLLSEGTEPIAVVKANAYGHGALPVATALAAVGVRRFAVATLEEGLALRPALPTAELLVLGYVPPAAARLAAEAALTLAVFDLRYAKALSQTLGNHMLRVHIKLNTGMNRYGFRLTPEEIDRTLGEIRSIVSLGGLRPTGIFSHLATADEPALPGAALAAARFRAALSALSRMGISLPAHLAASAAVQTGLCRGLPFSRLGLALYGYSPLGAEEGLLPVARLEADLATVYEIGRGESVGYGATYRARRRERIGILPIGYADGLPRAATGGYVRVGGHPCPLIGRISMDAAAVLLSGAPRTARSATVFGERQEDLLRLAEAAHTIPYELLAGLGARIDRKYTYEDPTRIGDS